MMRRAVFPAAWILAACGGIFSKDASVDSGRDSGTTLDGDAGYTQCTGPYGAKLCGGPAMCDVGCPEKRCSGDLAGPTSDLRICTTGRAGGTADSNGCWECVDGYECIFTDARTVYLGFDIMECWAPEYGVLLSMNGHADWVRYPDRSTYTGDPLPEPPASCPNILGLQLCGGACGECPSGYVCIGRSPLHPYSLCVNKWSGGQPCSRTDPKCLGYVPQRKCLTFKVDNAAQSVADKYSLCVDATICDAAAVSYPGGAFCGP